jgi:hypothetical protein
MLMKTLEDIATTYSQLAQLYLISGNWKPAFKTGNLYNTLGSYNTAARMITTTSSTSNTTLELPQKGFNIALQFAPPGARYGKWVEWGNGTGVGAGNPRPFAEEASKDPLLKKTIDAYIGGYVEKDFLPVIKIGLDRAFRSLSAERKAR